MKFRVAFVEVNPIGAMLEQIDRRSAEQTEIRRVDDVLQHRVGTIEQQDDLQRRIVVPPYGLRQIAQLEEQIALRKSEELVQQSITGERFRNDREHRLRVFE